jgi:hypothetical protein
MIFSIAFMLAASTPEADAALPALSTQVDARRLQTGDFIYRDSAQGEALGESSISIKFENSDSNYHFSSQTTGYAEQRWECGRLDFADSDLREADFWQGRRSTHRLSTQSGAVHSRTSNTRASLSDHFPCTGVAEHE